MRLGEGERRKGWKEERAIRRRGDCEREEERKKEGRLGGGLR